MNKQVFVFAAMVVGMKLWEIVPGVAGVAFVTAKVVAVLTVPQALVAFTEMVPATFITKTTAFVP